MKYHIIKTKKYIYITKENEIIKTIKRTKCKELFLFEIEEYLLWATINKTN